MAIHMPHQVLYFDRSKQEQCPYSEEGVMINPTVQVHCDMVLFTESHVSFQYFEQQIKVIKNVLLEDLYEVYFYRNNGELIQA